jgi:hypothetical protein
MGQGEDGQWGDSGLPPPTSLGVIHSGDLTVFHSGYILPTVAAEGPQGVRAKILQVPRLS